MKNISFLALIALLTVFTSCSKDDNLPTPQVEVEPSIIGNWEVEEFYIGNEDLLYEEEIESMIYTFNSNGDFDIEVKFGGEKYDFRGDWELDGDELEMTYKVEALLEEWTNSLKEEYEITFKEGDKLEMETRVSGEKVEIELERD